MAPMHGMLMKDIVPVACTMLAWNLNYCMLLERMEVWTGHGYTSRAGGGSQLTRGSLIQRTTRLVRFSNCKPNCGRPFRVAR